MLMTVIPFLDAIDFTIASPDTALQMYEEGKLDWIGSPFSLIPTDAVRSLKSEGLLQVSPFFGTAFYRINTAPSLNGIKNPLADPKVRRALSLAIDRDGIVRSVLQGGQEAARSLVPPQMGLRTERYVQKKKEELAENLDGPITISYLNSERNAAVAQAIQKQWENAFGIRVQLEAVEPKVFYQRVSKREYQIAGGSWTADFNDPVNFLEVFKYKEGSANNTGWENLEFIDFLNRSSVCSGGTERDELLQIAEAILLEEMPIIPIYHFALNFVKRPELSGVVLAPTGRLDLRRACFIAEGNR